MKKRKARRSKQAVSDRVTPASGRLLSATPVRTLFRVYEEMIAAQFKFEQLQRELRDRLGL